MEQGSIFVGIDVAKAQVDVAVRPADDRWEVAQDDTAIGQLVSQLKDLEPAMVLVEASGGLELPLVAALATEELPVVVVNPRQARDAEDTQRRSCWRTTAGSSSRSTATGPTTTTQAASGRRSSWSWTTAIARMPTSRRGRCSSGC